jgi:hypothetical protein
LTSPGKNGFSERSSSGVWSVIDLSICHYGNLTMLLEVLLASSNKLDSSELVSIMPLVTALSFESETIYIPTSLESRDNGSNQTTLQSVSKQSSIQIHNARAYLDAVRLDRNEAIYENQLHRQIARRINTGRETYVCSVDMVSSLSLARSFRWLADARRNP